MGVGVQVYASPSPHDHHHHHNNNLYALTLLDAGVATTATVPGCAGHQTEEPKEDFLTWLSGKGISEKDCEILKGLFSACVMHSRHNQSFDVFLTSDNEINREAFQLLNVEDLKHLKLSYGAQIIIKKLLNLR